MASYTDAWQHSPEVAMRRIVVTQIDRINALLSSEVVPGGAVSALDACCASLFDEDEGFTTEKAEWDAKFHVADGAVVLDDEDDAARYWRGLYKLMMRAITDRGLMAPPVGVEYVASTPGMDELAAALAQDEVGG